VRLIPLNGIDLPAARQLLEELNDQNLIGEPARGRYRLHNLLREHAMVLAAADATPENRPRSVGCWITTSIPP
jgi:hypothetical protein